MPVSRKGQDYCLVLGSEKFRHRALLGAARVTDLPIAILAPDACVNGHAFADLSLSGNHCHPRQALAAIERWQARSGARPRAVVPLIEMCLEAGQAIAQAYGLRYLSAAAMGRARNKYEMRRAFEAAGLPVPRYRPFGHLDELRQQAAQLRFPIVIKPRNAGGSEGVVLVRTPQELPAAFEHLAGAMAGYRERHDLDESLFLAEEYVDAPYEVSVILATSPRGIAVLGVEDKYLGAPPYFVEMGHSMPSVFAGSEVVRATAIAACRALGVDRGVVEVEMKLHDAQRVVLMELNARPPGDCSLDMLESASGVNLFEMHARAYLGDDVEPEPVPLQGRAAIAFMNAAPGTVARVRLPGADQLPDGVVALQAWRRPGERIVRSHDSNSRDGSVQFYWPEDPATHWLTEHLRVAAQLAEQIYECR